ncbi:MAG TPA: carbohydrate-binding module family 20 domain-containing protein, partial [Phototrophicaceae bacterium]|nr:carbohydrate-binding module family 20 domain-containing protein [Phototrophicaceae bacterium]
EPTPAEPVQVARLVVPVTFTVEVSARTNSDVYIAGDFHSAEYPLWDPAGLKLTQADDTHWTITLNIPEGETIEYKYVRGDWSAVEKDATCQEIANRRVTVRPGASGTVDVTDSVIKWRDLDQCG